MADARDNTLDAPAWGAVQRPAGRASERTIEGTIERPVLDELFCSYEESVASAAVARGQRGEGHSDRREVTVATSL
jgi:hypothetical protein